MNPINRQINKDDASDTGMESVRFGYTSAKKAVSGIRSAGQTTRNTRRTIRTTGTAAKETGKAAIKAAQAAARTTMKITKIAADAAATVIAELTSPVILIFAVVIILFLLLASLVVFITSGSAAGTTMQRAYQEAAGLVEVDPQYDLGKQLLAQVWNEKHDEFNRLIDGLYYDINNLPHSNLVYLERTEPEAPKKVFDKGFPTGDYKDNIKNDAWDFSYKEEEILAIVYVYMEVQENQANGTTDGLYQVTFTEDAVRAVIDKCVMFTDTVYNGQYCKNQNCTVHTDRHKNPEWERANDENNRRWNTYWDWYNNVYSVIYDNGNIRDGTAAQAHWNNTVQPAIDRWQRDHNRTAYNVTWERGYWFCNSVLLPEARDSENWKNNTPEYITDTSYSCEHAHDLHSIGLAFYSAEDVMSALGFSENEKKWAEMTVKAFEQQNTGGSP
ncbi:MAG: hypothetical protein IKN55_06480 [Oscillospiraceae bacterium]|nr:hypothetical protein [Oscillospiraceae bacterium]